MQQPHGRPRRGVLQLSIIAACDLQIKPKSETKLKDAKGEPVWTDREIAGLGKVCVSLMTLLHEVWCTYL